MEKILLGGYTNRENQGIGQIYLDVDQKQLRDYRLVFKVEKPTYLVQRGGEIFSCLQRGSQSGMVMVENGLEKGKQLAEGSAPCHISVDSHRPYFYLSYYHQGLVTVVERRGNDLVETCRIRHEGSSIHPNQEKSHVHFAHVCPQGNFLFVCDLGTDEVYLYMPQEDGSLREHSRISMPEGFGPRHLAFHPKPSRPIIYVLGELSNQILVLENQDGTWLEKQVISTLPEGFTEKSAGAAIRITKDGKHLYASNRGNNSIAVYQLLSDGCLKIVEYVPSRGRSPRDFALNLSEDFLVVAHQDSGNLTLFERDKETGKLTLRQQDVPAPECVCVCFVHD